MKYLNIALVHFEDAIQQRARNFVEFVIAFLNPLIALLFWTGAYSHRTVIGGWTLPEIQVYYLLLIVAQSALVSHVEYDVAFYDIKDGNLVSSLLKPVSYLWMKLNGEVPWRLIQGVYGIIALIIIFAATHIIPAAPDLTFVAISLVAAACGFLISFLFKINLALLSLWLTDINSLLEFAQVFLLVLSGVIMPIDLLPSWAATIAWYTPYPYIIYAPVTIFIGRHTVESSGILILTQIAWIAALYGLYKLIWHYGIRRFSGVGQ